MKEELEVHVFGRVQGVNFRSTLKSIADDLHLPGEAQNLLDGSVRIVVQGEHAGLEQFITLLRANPGFAKIEGISYRFVPLRKEYLDFVIVREGGYLADRISGVVRLGKQIVTAGKTKFPTHIVIIPDGNRRWARAKGKEPSFGHYSAGSYEHLMSLFDEAKAYGVKYVSIWGFSTENWNRNAGEIKAIFDLIFSSVDRFRADAHKNKICFRHIGRKDRLPQGLVDALTRLEDETRSYTEFHIQLCLDYGGRDELVRSVNKMLNAGLSTVDESNFSDYLDTTGIPDPDLIIRTSGEKRTSGFMPYQSVYAELFFSEKYFPDFEARDLRFALDEFSGRIRRFGGTAKEDLVPLKKASKRN